MSATSAELPKGVRTLSSRAEAKVGNLRIRQRVESRARLLHAARLVFEEMRYQDVRISDIAQRAGASHGLFYHYFTSKQEVFREVAATVYAELSESLDRYSQVELEMPFAERVTSSLKTSMREHLRTARIISVIEEVARYDDEVALMRDQRRERGIFQVAAVIASMQIQGDADPELDPRLTAMALHLMTTNFCDWWATTGSMDIDFESAVDQLARLVLNALRVTP